MADADRIRTVPDQIETRAEDDHGPADVQIILQGAGPMTRWNYHMGVPKTLAPVDGTPLLVDTIAKLKALGCRRILVSTAQELPSELGVEVRRFDAPRPDSGADKLVSTQDAWSATAPTVILFADVWFSATALRAILDASNGMITILGRLTPGHFTGKRYQEIFGLKFGPEQRALIDDALKEVDVPAPDRTVRPTGWRLYAALARQLDGQGGARVAFLHVDDFTEDFDIPEDHATWTARRSSGRHTWSEPVFPPNPAKRRLRLYQRSFWATVTILIGLGLGLLIG